MEMANHFCAHSPLEMFLMGERKKIFETLLSEIKWTNVYRVEISEKYFLLTSISISVCFVPQCLRYSGASTKVPSISDIYLEKSTSHVHSSRTICWVWWPMYCGTYIACDNHLTVASPLGCDRLCICNKLERLFARIFIAFWCI